MKYCKRCKHLHNDEEQICSVCNKATLELAQNDSSVYIHSAGGFELQRIQAAFEDEKIPCVAVAQNKNFSAEVVTGCDGAEYDILVPFAEYEKAYDVCVGIGVFKNDEAEICDDSDITAEENAEYPQKMSAGKRIISAMCFLIIVAGVVFGTDAIIRLIQSLFA